jgi:hypothetical protein
VTRRGSRIGGNREVAVVLAALIDLALVACGGEGPDSRSVVPPAPTTTIDAYGTDPNAASGPRQAVCRNGAAADRPGRVELAAYIDDRWPRVVSVLGFECREINDPSDPACRGRVRPRRSRCWSTHAAGRAIDIVVGGAADRGTPAGISLGNRIVSAFLAEVDGTAHWLARVTGVQQILWHGRCWTPDDAEVTAATDMTRCPVRGHDNHVHLTLSEAGADGETSWYR